MLKSRQREEKKRVGDHVIQLSTCLGTFLLFFFLSTLSHEHQHRLTGDSEAGRGETQRENTKLQGPGSLLLLFLTARFFVAASAPALWVKGYPRLTICFKHFSPRPEA